MADDISKVHADFVKTFTYKKKKIFLSEVDKVIAARTAGEPFPLSDVAHTPLSDVAHTAEYRQAVQHVADLSTEGKEAFLKEADLNPALKERLAQGLGNAKTWLTETTQQTTEWLKDTAETAKAHITETSQVAGSWVKRTGGNAAKSLEQHSGKAALIAGGIAAAALLIPDKENQVPGPDGGDSTVTEKKWGGGKKALVIGGGTVAVAIPAAKHFGLLEKLAEGASAAGHAR